MKSLIPYDVAAYEMLQQGVIALARVESNGIRVDERYIEHELKKQQSRVDRKRTKLAKSKVVKIWRKHYKTKTNFDSNEQLGHVLFDLMGYKCPNRTKHGKYKTDIATLQTVDNPFVQRHLGIRKILKGMQFLKGIRAETCNGLIHPVFNLHFIRTFRSSSNDPNFQNIPVRDKWMREMVRRAIIARKGHRIVELDYSGVEVRVSCCYHNDPTMIRYIKDPSTDMHRDMAMQCFRLPKSEITKAIRHVAKNQFVFPQFYGAWWLDCANGMWNDSSELVTESGVLLRDHLKRKGIVRVGRQTRERPDTKQGTFGHHIKKVEKQFWGKRFPVYAQWKKDWYNEYLQDGWFKSKTGFVYQGQMARNDVINYPVQGAAFHCLLQSLIWLVNEELDAAGMKTKIIGQIHDSIVADVPKEETDDYIALANNIMTERLTDEWDWINVPLEIEAEMTPVGGSWVEKEVVEI